MKNANCDCCLKFKSTIIPYGSSYLCLSCFAKYQKGLIRSPVIRKTELNSAKIIIKELNKDPFFRVEQFLIKRLLVLKKGE